MLAARVGAVVRGVVVDDFDVGGESSARVGAFDEVVAEERVAGEALLEHGVERVNLVDALSGEAAFGVKVLVDVRDGAGVNIDSGLAGVERGEARLQGRVDADADAGLEDSVSGGDDAAFGINDSAVERMRHCADHGGGGAARQLRVRVEGDDVAHARKGGEIAGLDGKGVEFSAQIFVEVEQLATLALPAHPDALARVEDAMAMEEEE